MRYLPIISLALLTTACGGDGGDSSSTPFVPHTPVETGIINIDESFVQGQSTELILFEPNQNITEPNWVQLSGPSVELFAANSKVLSFTIPNAGEYRFEVSYRANGIQKEDTVSFSAATGSPSLVARLGHSVIEGNNVSLRAFIGDNVIEDSITWDKISGPSISLDNNNQDPQLLIFESPLVTEDSLIRFEVTAQTSSGQIVSDTVAVLIENAADIPINAIFDGDDVVAKVYSYKADSPYKEVLTNCVYSNQFSSSCLLGTLPELAQDSNGETPTIEQVMNRVVVSHDWMGERFEQYLKTFDEHDDFKNLLRATTAIVLSYDIRPSFYWGLTGAIYLDPSDLWLTPEERDTINEAPDYRSSFGSDLQFLIPYRYVKDNEYVSFFYPPNDRFSRQLSDIKYDLANLLYHELGHANDYFPWDEWNTYPDNYRFDQAVVASPQISSDLSNLYPLNSQEMTDLAATRFLGEDITETQKNYSPDDVAVFYQNDHANDFYNYTTEREDLSMLFEELMMYTRYGISRDTAVLDEDNLIVSWGQRGRVGQSDITPRSAYVASRVLPEYDLELTKTLPVPISMTRGLDWWDNLPISPQPLSRALSIESSEKQRHKQPIRFKTFGQRGNVSPLRSH